MTLTDLVVAVIVVAMLAPPVTFAWDAFAKRHPYLVDDILDWWDYRRARRHWHRGIAGVGHRGRAADAGSGRPNAAGPAWSRPSCR